MTYSKEMRRKLKPLLHHGKFYRHAKDRAKWLVKNGLVAGILTGTWGYLASALVQAGTSDPQGTTL